MNDYEVALVLSVLFGSTVVYLLGYWIGYWSGREAAHQDIRDMHRNAGLVNRERFTK